MSNGPLVNAPYVAPDRLTNPGGMTEGNIDMIGRLCASMADLRGQIDRQAAKIDSLRTRVLDLENKLAEMRNLAAREGKIATAR